MRKFLICLTLLLVSMFMASILHAQKNVYIVPDEETFLYYIGEWSPDKKFPIFIRETAYSEKFNKAYSPDSIKKVKKENIGGVSTDSIFRALAASFTDEGIEDIPRGDGDGVVDGDAWGGR